MTNPVKSDVSLPASPSPKSTVDRLRRLGALHGGLAPFGAGAVFVLWLLVQAQVHYYQGTHLGFIEFVVIGLGSAMFWFACKVWEVMFLWAAHLLELLVELRDANMAVVSVAGPASAASVVAVSSAETEGASMPPESTERPHVDAF